MSISQRSAPMRQPRARLPRVAGSTAAGTSAKTGAPTNSRPKTTTTAAPVHLRVVAPADSRESSSAAFIAACVLVLALGLAALLILNTQRAQQSFTINSLKAESATYTGTQQGLSSALQLAESPRSLAARAQAMGLAPASKVRYVGPDGKTVGVAKGAAGSIPFTVGPLTSGGASKVAGAATLGASLGARLGAPVPKATAAPDPAKATDKPGATATKPAAPTKPGSTGKASPSTKTKPSAKAKPTATPKATPKGTAKPKAKDAPKSKSTSGTTTTTQR